MSDPPSFGGADSPTEVVRLFPLNGVVLFPHGLLPLHIFEPRYRQMTQDALAGDRAIAMATPEDSSASTTSEPLHSVACVGRIHQERQMPDGRFKFVLRGESRVRIERELPMNGLLYRRAAASLLPDVLGAHLEVRRKLQRSYLLGLFRKLMPADNDGATQLYHFLRDKCPPGVFADVLAYAAPLPIASKLLLLETTSVDQRLEHLASVLPTAVEGLPPQPAAAMEFSDN